MNKIWLIAKTNLVKSKSAVISLGFILMVAALFLDLGCLSVINYQKLFDRYTEKLNSAHAALVMRQTSYQNDFEEYFKEYPGVSQVQKEDTVYLMSSKYKYGKGEITSAAVFLSATDKRKLSYLSFVGDKLEESNTDIYLSYLFHRGGAYEIGDEFILYYRDRELKFRIAGFYEDILLGSSNMGCAGFYLPDSSYQRLREELKDSKLTDGVLLQARLNKPSEADNLISDFQKSMLTNESNSNYWFVSLKDVKNARTMTANISGVIVISFSVIIILVSLLIIRFRIVTSIEESMADIGVIKAIGYTGRQIILTNVVQFLTISVIAAIIGILISNLVVGYLAAMYETQTGLIWKPGFDIKAAIISLAIIFLAVILIVPLSSNRIRRLHPILALRSGIYTHNFKKNHFPLERTGGNLNLCLALKSMRINLKQSIMIILIIASVSFASVFGVVCYYNMAVENKAFIDMYGVEMSSVYTTTIPDTDTDSLTEEIKKMEGVRKAISYNYEMVSVGDTLIQGYIMKDFSMLENNQIYDGRYPKYDNEVAITGILAQLLHKKTGNVIKLQLGNKTEDYIITGLFKNANNLGKGISMTMDGARRLQPDYQPNGINIYLEEGEDTDKFITELSHSYGKQLAGTMNMEMMFEGQLGGYKYFATMFAYVILLVTLLVIGLTLFLVMKAYIIRHKKEYGIQKAIGFTSWQLMRQTTYSFLPLILIGAFAGCTLGGAYINSVISTMFRQIGIMNVEFIIPYGYLFTMCIGFGIIAFIISILVALRIRKISAYSLIIDC